MTDQNGPGATGMPVPQDIDDAITALQSIKLMVKQLGKTTQFALAMYQDNVALTAKVADLEKRVADLVAITPLATMPEPVITVYTGSDGPVASAPPATGADVPPVADQGDGPKTE